MNLVTEKKSQSWGKRTYVFGQGHAEDVVLMVFERNLMKVVGADDTKTNG